MINGENQAKRWVESDTGDTSRGKIHCDNGLVFGKPNPNQLPQFLYPVLG